MRVVCMTIERLIGFYKHQTRLLLL